MSIKFDWKYFLMFVLAALGVVFTVWQPDFSSKSMTVRQISKTALQPKEQDALPGVEVSIEGTKLIEPFLVVFEIKNDGGKPITAADFESPLEIRVDGGASFVRARVSATMPSDLDTLATVDTRKISLKPSLLNMGDSIVVSGITSGGVPSFSLKARVIGIPKIGLVEGIIEENARHTTRTIIYLTVAAFLLFTAANAAMPSNKLSNGSKLRPRATLFVTLTCFLCGIGVFAQMAIIDSQIGKWTTLWLIAPVMIGSLISSIWLNKDVGVEVNQN